MHNTNMMICALKGDKIALVSEVENGAKCGCVCIDCHENVVAKNNENNVKAKHFAHAVANPDCNYCHETYIHWAAKKIICEMKEMWVPEHEIVTGGEIYVLKAEILNIDHAEDEVRLDGIQPDVLITSGGKRIGIEICVTNPLDIDRLIRYNALNISVLEIDLSETDRAIMEDDLRKILEEKTTRKKWRFHVFSDKYIKRHRTTPVFTSRKNRSRDSPANILRNIIASASGVKQTIPEKKSMVDAYEKNKHFKIRPLDLVNNEHICKSCPLYGRPAKYFKDCQRCRFHMGVGDDGMSVKCSWQC